MTTSAFVKTPEGRYRLIGDVEPDVIIKQASSLLLESLCNGQELKSSLQTADFLQMALANEPNEHFSALFLNNNQQVIAFEHLFKGTIDYTVIHPRIVVQRALMLNATYVIVAHNHPSDEPVFTPADEIITEKLKDALALVDIRLMDHFVITRKDCLSFVECCLM